MEDDYDTEEGEESEIFVVYNSSLAAHKKNLVNINFPYIDTFYHEGLALISTMRDLTVGVFENLEITSPMELYQRIAYTQRILKGDALKNYIEVLVACRKL